MTDDLRAVERRLKSATDALKALATSERVSVTDPRVRATVYALADLGLLSQPYEPPPIPSPERRSHRRRPSLQPVDGTRRRLQALAREGLSPTQAARKIGLDERLVRHYAAGTSGSTVQAKTYERVKDFYESGPHRPEGVRTGDVLKVVRFAHANGWASREAWEGLDIDDPSVQPRDTVV